MIDLNAKYASIRAMTDEAKAVSELLIDQQECEAGCSCTENVEAVKNGIRNKAGDKVTRVRVISCILFSLIYVAVNIIGYVMQGTLELIVTMAFQIVLTALFVRSLYRIVDEGEGWVGLVIFGILDVISLFYFASFNAKSGAGVFSYLSSAALAVAILVGALVFTVLKEERYYKKMMKSPSTLARIKEAEKEDREEAAECRKALTEIKAELKRYSGMHDVLKHYVKRAREDEIPALPKDDVELIRRLVNMLEESCEKLERFTQNGEMEGKKAEPASFFDLAYCNFWDAQADMNDSAERAKEALHDIYSRIR